MTVYLSTEHFEHSKIAAANITAKARAKRAESGPLPEEWDIEDHLVALKARISPLKCIGTDLLTASIRVHGTLWPGRAPPKSVAELCRGLQGAEKRLREWRSFSTRAGADQALTPCALLV